LPPPSESDVPPTRRFATSRIELVRGDITEQTVDAIVNAANGSLMGGGGVDGAIHRAGGAAILEDCKRIRATRGPLAAGQAAITGAGRLLCRHVIHAVGPVWRGGGSGEPEALASCYRESLALAAAHGVRTIAFPSISTGIFGYPVTLAAPLALNTVGTLLAAGSAVEIVRFVLFSDPDFQVYRTALGQRGPS
jgi:O-acetyl-ADP-ribose deacetylase (regulator of RNase III)